MMTTSHWPMKMCAGGAIVASILGLPGCGGGGDSSLSGNPAAPATLLTCDDSMKTAFKPDNDTSVLLVKAFRKGDALLLSGTAASSTPAADSDVCVVKLNVGPGHPGPAGAPSTSAGVGIEVWLPSPANWNGRIHAKGGSGWQGTNEGSTTSLAGTSNGDDSAASTAMIEGAVSATTDTGHVGAPALLGAEFVVLDASFAMNPDGTINTTLWEDFAERGVHEMAVKTKALAKAYYGRDAKYSYLEGISTGGRQGLKEAQLYAQDFDGILAESPSINWSKLVTGELYPQIVMLRDLGGNLTSGQLDLVSNAAIAACDAVGGKHLGYLPDPSNCTYNPVVDPRVLCPASGGGNSSADCVTAAQANAIDKIWYGQTTNGSVPDPATDNGFGVQTAPNQKWYGVSRGTTLGGGLSGAQAFPIAADMVALELQNSALGSPLFRNATGNGAQGWKALTYAELAGAWDMGVALQPQFGSVNTDDPDLSGFKNRNGKIILVHGLADQLVPPQGSINYYNRVANQMGGVASIQSFIRLYLVPGQGHGFYNGTSNPNANPPLPTSAQFYGLLTDWSEKSMAPGTLTVTAAATANAPSASRPLCPYPLTAAYISGDPLQDSSYICS